MYLTKTPPILKQFSKDLIWSLPTDEKVLYLTFDDGPIPEVTPDVLDILDRYNAKATFFCVANNAMKYPLLLKEIVNRGHAIGNHTYSHKEGWKTSLFGYLKDFLKAENILGKSGLFRPPYGRISPQQITALKKHTKIVMWDVLSADFDVNIDFKQCAKNVINSAQKGSIIVLHDSIKAQDRVLKALPLILDHFSDYEFKSLEKIKNGERI